MSTKQPPGIESFSWKQKIQWVRQPAVVQETLRMYPVVMFALPRLVKGPVQILGYDLEPGTVVSPCIYLTHHRPDLYPDPKRFNPERFLERQFASSEYLPFGGGNRRCLGLAFALFEMKLVLATVLSNWEMELADSQPVKPVRRGLLIAPENGVPMVVKGKRTPVSAASESDSIAV